ncbi:MAG TPA: NAD-dependent epimerase/dehydratase family protein, partial [Agromyces mariniharenae]|nr:NAD-dependent epimerase/dehydratase family protein [Agromyces mariniharenae]
EVRAMVAEGGADAADVEFAELDLSHDDGWLDAASGATYVLHVASPFPTTQPRDPDELIVPARDGAVRALRAARETRVRRVVLTSSFAAVGYGAPHPDRPYTEDDWTDPTDERLTPYVRSKAVAERAAWDFIDREAPDLELAVVNPVAVFGPTLGRDLSSSLQLLLTFLNGEVRGIPDAATNAVDVRDVAALHLAAMTHPDAAGERFLAVAGDPMPFTEVAAMLREHLGDAARHVPTRAVPSWVVRIAARFDPDVRAVLPQLGRRPYASHAKAERMLDWHPRSNEAAILASAESLLRLGLVRG